MLELLNIKTIDEQLRDYQLENKIKIYNNWAVSKSVMLQMPTGTGKTRLFASIVKDIHNLSIQNKKAYKVLILAHRQELIKQISENIGIRYGIAHGKIMSKNWEEDFYPTQVASVQTLTRRLEKWGEKKFDFIIIDEAHHALAPTYIKICKEFPEAKILGVTATPYRLSKASFRTMFDNLIISDSIIEFIKKGYLSDYEYYSIKPSSKIQKLVDSINEFDFDGDYAEKALSKTFDKDKIRANLLQTYYKYAEGKKGIIYTINKSHNEHVCKIFVDAGINAKSIDSGTKSEERNKIVREFKNGDIQILCNVNIFSEGFDCPDVEFIQLARPTKSLAMYLQQVGRGFRIHEEKEKVIFLDNVGLFNRFGLPSVNRKWLKHFDGNNLSEDEYKPQSLIAEKINFIELDIEEGNENIELVFSSNKIKETFINKNEFESIEDFDLIIYENVDVDLNDISKCDDDSLKLLLMLHGNDEDITLHDYILDEYEFYEDNTFLNRYNNIKKIELNGKFGLFDEKKGQLILEPIYEEIFPFNIYGEIQIKVQGKIGIFNLLNESIVIQPDYDEILHVLNRPNFNITVLNNQYGLISKSNNLIIKPFSNYITEIKNYFIVESELDWQLFNSNFFQINFNEFEIVDELKNFYIVKYEELYAISNGEILIFPFLISSYKIISKGRTIIYHIYNGSYVVDENLDYVIKPNQYNEIEIINDNFFKISKWSLVGVVDIEGRIIIPVEYNYCNLINNLFFIVYKNLWISIDFNGKILYSSNKKKNTILKTIELINKQKVINTIEIENNNKLKLFDECKIMYDNVKNIRLNIVLRELNISFKTAHEIIEEITNSNDILNPNSKISLAEYNYLKRFLSNDF